MTDHWMEEPLWAEFDRERSDVDGSLWLERELGTLLPLVGARVPVPPAQWERVRGRLRLDKGSMLAGRICAMAASSVVSLLLVFSLTLPPVHARELGSAGPQIQLVPVPQERTGAIKRTSSAPAVGTEASVPTFAPLPTPPEPLSE